MQNQNFSNIVQNLTLRAYTTASVACYWAGVIKSFCSPQNSQTHEKSKTFPTNRPTRPKITNRQKEKKLKNQGNHLLEI